MGRGHSRAAKLAASLLLALALLLSLPSLALAYDDPDDLEILSVKVFRHLIETDDYLIVAHVNIHYDSGQPEANSDQLFLMRLMDTGNSTILGASTTYPFYNDGYDEGVISLYWGADEAPTWEQNYTLRLEENPAQFTSPVITSYVLQVSDYTDLSTQAEQQDALGDYLVDVLDSLETNWSMDGELYTYGTTGVVLTSVGEAYFVGAIPALQTMCPDLFTVQILSPTTTTQTYTQEKAQEYASRWDGTIVGDFIDAAGDFFGGVSGQLITTAICVAAVLGIVFFAILKNQPAAGAFLAGWPIILLGAAAGFVVYPILGIIGFCATALLGYFWIFRHASG